MMKLIAAFTSLTLFTQMLVIGLNLSTDSLTRLATDPRALWRVVLSVLLIVPAAALLLIMLLPLRPEVAAGLAILAASPAAPLTSRRSKLADADIEFVGAVQIIMAIAAVAFTPLILSAFRTLLDLPLIQAGVLDVAFQVSKVTLAPVILGLVLRRFGPIFVARHQAKLALAGDCMLGILLFGIALTLAFSAEMRGNLLVGWFGCLAFSLMAITALASGHLVGGPSLRRRSGLAIASVARNLGLALYVAELSPEVDALGGILAYALIGGAIAIPYSVWAKRQSGAQDLKVPLGAP